MTQESVQGTSGQVGWADVARTNAVDHFSTTRRLSFRTGQVEEPPPEYPGERFTVHMCMYITKYILNYIMCSASRLHVCPLIQSICTGPPSLAVGSGGRSFDPAELGDSSDEDDNLFIAPAPPDYQEVVK